jgi:hypothetical protein
MREFDLRWVVVPVLAALALTVGNSDPWLVALAAASGFAITLRI